MSAKHEWKPLRRLAEIALWPSMHHEFGFLHLLLIGAIVFLIARAIPYLAIGAIVLMLVAGMFPGDPVAGFIGNLAASLVAPLVLFWILWTAIKMIIGFKPRRHRSQREHE